MPLPASATLAGRRAVESAVPAVADLSERESKWSVEVLWCVSYDLFYKATLRASHALVVPRPTSAVMVAALARRRPLPAWAATTARAAVATAPMAACRAVMRAALRAVLTAASAVAAMAAAVVS